MDIIKCKNCDSELTQEMVNNGICWHCGNVIEFKTIVEPPKEEREIQTVAPVEVTLNHELYGEPVFTVHGCRGRHLFVFEKYVVIKTVVTIGSVISGNSTDGEKLIFYKDCIGLQYKEPGFTVGYIQIETSSGQMNNLKDNHFAENSFTFDAGNEEEILKVYKYILEKVAQTK